MPVFLGQETDEELIEKYNIKPTDKILDVGGSAKQHTKIKIHTLLDLVPPKEVPYKRASNLNSQRFVKADLNKDKFPFKDNEFDFVLCTHTLEDIDTPFLALEEMSRVGKRGYIATPARGFDSEFSHFDLTNWLTGPRRVPGHAHHHWFFENKNGKMYITPKNYPLLYTHEFAVTAWLGDEEFRFYWEGEIKYEGYASTSFHKLIENYRQFTKENKQLIKRGTPLLYLDNPFYILKAYLKLILKKGAGFEN